MKVSLCVSEPSRARTLMQVALETRTRRRKIKECTNNLGWKVLSLSPDGAPSPLSSVSVSRGTPPRSRNPFCSYFTASCAIKNTSSRGLPRVFPGLLSSPHLLLHLVYTRGYLRDAATRSSLASSPRARARARSTPLRIVPTICKSSRLLEARSIRLFYTVS